MSILRMAAGICYAAHVLILIVMGVRYLSSKKFQPYHAVALGRDWKSLDPALQVLLLSFIRGVGAVLLLSQLAPSQYSYSPSARALLGQLMSSLFLSSLPRSQHGGAQEALLRPPAHPCLSVWL